MLWPFVDNVVFAVPGREEMMTVLSTDHGRFLGQGEEPAGHTGNLPWPDPVLRPKQSVGYER